MHAACKIDYTFNWFYIDSEHIAYFNSGKNPVRAREGRPELPDAGRADVQWQGFDPSIHDDRPRRRAREHPQVIDQQYLSSWNNKQARGYRAADGNCGYSSLYRVDSLDERIEAGIAGSQEDDPVGADQRDGGRGGTVDLRGAQVLPLALKVIRKTGPVDDPQLRHAIDVLHGVGQLGRPPARRRRQRRLRARRGDADHGRLVAACCSRRVPADARREPLRRDRERAAGSTTRPRDHLGSAYQDGWYGYVAEGPAHVLGKQVKGRYSRVYCGGGKLGGCRAALLGSLAGRARRCPTPSSTRVDGCTEGDAQWCYDAVGFRRRRADRPALDPLDQPADLPAGRRDPRPPLAPAG